MKKCEHGSLKKDCAVCKFCSDQERRFSLFTRGDGTCIICGGKFNRMVQSSNGTLQFNIKKTTCSPKCRAKADANLKREKRRKMKEAQA